jgi:hypothetical protein
MTDDANRKRFTAQKLDLLTCIAFDKRVEPYAFKVAFCIAQHANERTGKAFIADETIVEKIGGTRRRVVRARIQLRAAGWFIWKRTRTANVYEPKYHQVERVLDMMTATADDRKERQKRRRRDVSPASHLNRPDVTPALHQDVTPALHIHLQENTLQKEETTKEELIKRDEERGMDGRGRAGGKRRASFARRADRVARAEAEIAGRSNLVRLDRLGSFHPAVLRGKKPRAAAAQHERKDRVR